MKTYTLVLLSIGASLGASTFAVADEAAPKPPKPRHHLTFEQADVDGNGGLSVFEYASLLGPGTPLAQVRKRFLPIDVSGAFDIEENSIPDGLITKEELRAYRELEEKPKSDLKRFDLADFDGDGLLSPLEFGYLVSPKVKDGKTLRKFNKLDKDDDGFISRREFKKSKSNPA